MEFCSELVLHYVPGHVYVIGNELADTYAKAAATRFTPQEQDQVCPSLPNLKSYLRTSLMDDWNEKMNEKLTPGFRQLILQNKTSQLKDRDPSPRPFQTLFSRYRVNRVEAAGEYAFKLKYTNDLTCRLCGVHRETISHLLDDCPGTRTICSDLNLSSLTLSNETPSSQHKVASFDGWLRERLQYSTRPPANRIQATLRSLAEEDKKKRRRESNDIEEPSTKRVKRQDSMSFVGSKRNCLVIPDTSLNCTIRSTKIRRISWTKDENE